MQNITIEALAKTPAFAAALRELEAGQLADRQAQIDAWRAYRAQWHAEQAEFAARAHAVRQELDQARARVRDLEQQADRANSEALWSATRATERDRALESSIVAGADPQLHLFRAWAARAANLAGVATYETVAAFAGSAAPATNAGLAREVARICAEATERADAMRREAVAADAVALELDAMAAGILQALNRLGGSAPARLPRDWRAPLI
ncbi:hypothetical protein IAI53_03170 [Thauera sp. CAU 1555]|uniref:Uncharacterized protein n=1 Tax=Thauera sedimentorum TaxID=2767595 RepID=A0ABR9B7J8_9RHOO|nr:hypothetical protein [Thauera sedimentorum]MBC9070955.1 hypothetical protein [Thauera sedimentorum]MBD8501874.1 hypothetical protein [Thauera sedimentorum]